MKYYKILFLQVVNTQNNFLAEEEDLSPFNYKVTVYNVDRT